MALSDLLDSLAKPNPTFPDGDEDFGDNTTAQLSVHGTEDDAKDGDQIQKSTKLKRQAASLLSDTDTRYAGRKTTRKDLMQDSGKGDSEDGVSSHDNDDDDEDGEEDDDDAEDGEEDDDDSNDGDEDIAGFRQLLQKKSLGSDGLKQSSEIEDDDGDDDDDAMAEDMDGNDGDDDDDDDEGDDGDSGSDASGDGDSDKDAESEEPAGQKESMDIEDPGVNMMKQLSNMSSDKQKGLAVQTQLGLLDNLLEGRIKLQRAVSFVNQIPQPSTWHHFQALGKDKYTSAVHSVQNQLCHLLNTLIHLQTSLLLKDTQTRHIVTGEEMSKDGDSKNDDIEDEDDEEIPSDDEGEVTVNPQSSVTVDCKVKKRKLLPPQIRGFLAKRARKFETCRNAVIQKWDTKTRLASGKLNKKSFSALEQSALKQIEQVLYDRERLIKRTQIQRSSYKIYGQPEKEESITDDRDDPVAVSKEEQDKNTRETEIFDDSDFYHLLLQDFIRKKSMIGNDASSVNRQYQEIQQLRDKKKRNVDPRASKGRKLR
ncbi:protein AATF isoform X2 [Octopus sinensis]|nr:protein AATF isoform X2 [Octopus sinensis]